jgi:DNA-binding NtrC family response regulator
MMTQAKLAQAREALGDLRDNLAKLSRNPLVLSVEDDRQDENFLKKKLQPFRVDLETCGTSKDAIELLKRKHFEVVLLDLRLDGGSGLDILSFAEAEKIKSYFIVLTGMDDGDPMISEAMSRGAHFVLQKPISEDHLRLIFGTIS